LQYHNDSKSLSVNTFIYILLSFGPENIRPTGLKVCCHLSSTRNNGIDNNHGSATKKMKRLLSFGCTITASLLLTACVTTYNPDPLLAEGLGEGIVVKQPFKVVNALKPTADRRLFPTQKVVNYYNFTESLVQALRAEYKLEEASNTASSDKQLKISISNIEGFISGVSMRYIVLTEVEYGNQSVEYFEADDNLLDTVFKKIVTDIMNNKNINNYLNQE
jgi:hypothetical protein